MMQFLSKIEKIIIMYNFISFIINLPPYVKGILGWVIAGLLLMGIIFICILSWRQTSRAQIIKKQNDKQIRKLESEKHELETQFIWLQLVSYKKIEREQANEIKEKYIELLRRIDELKKKNDHIILNPLIFFWKKIWVRIKIKVTLPFLFMLLFCRNDMNVLGKELIVILQDIFDGEIGPEVDKEMTNIEDGKGSELVSSNPDEETEQGLQKKETMQRNRKYRFLLRSEQLGKKMSPELYVLLFPDEQDIPDLCDVGKTLVETNFGKLNAYYDTEEEEKMGLEAFLAYIANELEIPFLQKIADGTDLIEYEDWVKTVPSSSDLIAIMNARLIATEMKGSGPYRRKLFFQLANDNQRMALECQVQGEDADTVLYYYGMSIAYGCISMYYPQGTVMDNDDAYIQNYIEMRYKDVWDFQMKRSQGISYSGSSFSVPEE